jgi:hypothetical protein
MLRRSNDRKRKERRMRMHSAHCMRRAQSVAVRETIVATDGLRRAEWPHCHNCAITGA